MISRDLKRRLARIELHQDETRQEREAMAARYAHFSRAELERLVLDEMTEYLAARSFPALAGIISPAAISQARTTFARHPACLVVIEAAITRQEPIHAPH